MLDNGIKFINESSFGPLISLKRLEIREQEEVSLTNMSQAFYGLRHSPLSVINISFINNGNFGDFTLKNNFFCNLENVTVEELYLTRSNIILIEPHVFKCMRHVKYLRLSYNYLIGTRAGIIINLLSLNRLILLDVSKQGRLQPVNKVFKEYLKQKSPYKQLSIRRKKHIHRFSAYHRWMLPIPQNLTFIYIAAAHIKGALSASFYKVNNVKLLDLSQNRISKLIKVSGLSKLEILNLQGVACVYLKIDFFSAFPNLRSALIGRNNLAKVIHDDKNGILFKNNSLLKVLDIEDTGVGFLPKGFLKTLSNTDLHVLNVSNNLLSDLDQFTSFPNLQFLNISKNRVEKISHFSMDWFENKARQKMKLDLSNNLITDAMQCCEIKEFIQWTKRTQVILFKNDSFKCRHERNIHFRNLTLDTLEELCPETSRETLAAIKIVSLLAVLALTLLSTLMYRYRHRFLWWHILIREYIKVKRECIYDTDYIYDAFVAYAGEDLGWVRKELISNLEIRQRFSLCLHQRDFQVGRPIIDNIVNNIQKSRCVILVLSKWFLQSDWCRFELDMAMNKEHVVHNDIIIPIFLEQINTGAASDVLKSILLHKTFIVWPKDRSIQLKTIFWKRLAKSIGKPLADQST